ncbi:MAG: ATP-dependent nuclease, partial [Flavipsychrobacter sp.]
LEGSNLTNYFKFNFSFKPPYAENLSNLYFDFEYNTEIPHRIIALIGKNGTGKTSILSDLINKFSKQILNNNSDKLPSFGKYFTVSYSVFDRFSVPESNVAFNYIYCGLKKADGLIKSEQEQIEDFFQSANKIKERDLTDRWFKILKNFLSESDLTLIFPDHNEDLPFSMVKFSEKNFNSIKSHFSSGESILIFIMTKIISEIRYDSLILYDEPETHLHPNAISSLMSSLFELVSSFRSFCVIATHSPLIVRELSAKDVYVLKRDNSDLEISKLNQDSFGENLTVITEDIFGNRDVNRHYLQIIENLVNKGYEFDKIIGLIKDDQIPVSLNVILYLRSLISRKYHDEP